MNNNLAELSMSAAKRCHNLGLEDRERIIFHAIRDAVKADRSSRENPTNERHRVGYYAGECDAGTKPRRE